MMTLLQPHRAVIERLESRRLCDGDPLVLTLTSASGGAAGADTVTVTGIASGTVSDGTTSASIKAEFVTNAVESDQSIQCQSASANVTLADASNPNYNLTLSLTANYSCGAGGADPGTEATVYGSFNKVFNGTNVTVSVYGTTGEGWGITTNFNQTPTFSITVGIEMLDTHLAKVTLNASLKF